MTPYISVIMPCYNKEDSLNMTLESIINQTIFSKLEIIAIDDKSKDNTLKELRKYANRYKNIKVYANKENKGVFATRLKGIKYANGEYIGFIDPDDKVDFEWFEELYKVAKRTKTDIIRTPSIYNWDGNDEIRENKNMFKNMEDDLILISPETIDKITRNNWMTLWNRLFKKDILKPLINLPRYRINFLEDMLICWCALMNAETVLNIRTKSHLYYNTSDDIEHLSKLNTTDRGQPTASIFNIIDSYIIQTKKTEFIVPVKRWRKFYIEHYAKEYEKLFSMTEGFTIYDPAYINNIIKTYQTLVNIAID